MGTALYWIALHPMDGDDRAIDQLPELGFENRSVDPEQVRERAALYARQAYRLNKQLNGPYEGLTYEAMRRVLYDRYFIRELPPERLRAGQRDQRPAARGALRRPGRS